jgi:predicted nucleotidyltransferase
MIWHSSRDFLLIFNSYLSKIRLKCMAKTKRIHIEVPEKAITDFCGRNRVQRLLFFGSVLRDDFRPESDVDILVEYEPGAVAGFLRLAAMENELSQILKRKVDLRTPAELSRYFRQEVLESAEIQYAQG